MPTDETLLLAWKSNTDGFGLAYGDGRQVQIRKGAMTPEEMLALIASCPDLTDLPVILHLRLATAGKVDPGNCHPYPISGSASRLRTTTLSCGAAIAHNGHIYSGSNSWYYGDDNYSGQLFVAGSKQEDTLTDTAEFIQEYLAGMPVKMLTNLKVLSLIQMATASKFALVTPTQLFLVGDFYKEPSELLVSNTYWHRTPVAPLKMVENSIALTQIPSTSIVADMYTAPSAPLYTDFGTPLRKSDPTPHNPSWVCEGCGEWSEDVGQEWGGMTLCDDCHREFVVGRAY